MEINGIAHVMLTVARFEECVVFYESLLNLMGLKTVFKDPNLLYCVGGRTAFGIQPADSGNVDDRFEQTRVGLHHVCFRARQREDVDRVYEYLVETGANIVHGPEEGVWAPGYYSILFEDPVGVRLEMNYVPGKGLLAAD